MAADREAIYRLRVVMARELETINQYEQFADATADPALQTLFQHLADEEKEHVMEVFEVLLQRDPAQAAWAESTHVQAIRADRLQEALDQGEPGRPSSPSANPPTVAPAAASLPAMPVANRLPALTVGSLLGQAYPGQ